MKRGRKILLALVGMHLGFVLCGAASLDLSRVPLVGRALAAYGGATGASSGYGFFAPGVGTQLRATFELEDAEGKKREESLAGPTHSHEAELRVGNFITAFYQYEDDKRARRAMTASWAGKLFNRYPDARKITVKIEQYELPGADEWARGARPRWTAYYQAKYAYGR